MIAPVSREQRSHETTGYSTALVALTVEDAENLSDKLNSRLGLDREAWVRLAAQSMDEEHDAPGDPAVH